MSMLEKQFSKILIIIPTRPIQVRLNLLAFQCELILGKKDLKGVMRFLFSCCVGATSCGL